MYASSPEDSDKYEVTSSSSMGDDVIDVFFLTIKDIAYEDQGGYNCYTFYGGKKIESTVLLKVDGMLLLLGIIFFVDLWKKKTHSF